MDFKGRFGHTATLFQTAFGLGNNHTNKVLEKQNIDSAKRLFCFTLNQLIHSPIINTLPVIKSHQRRGKDMNTRAEA